MLKRLIALSLNHSSWVVVAAVALLVAAAVSLRTMPVDVFPELNAPTVVLLTEAGGLGAEEVEQQVSFTIETAMTGLPGVRRVRSASALGLSLVWVEFGWGADQLRARQLVSERLATVKARLPDGVHPELSPMTSITGEIMLVSLRNKTDGTATTAHSELALRALAEFDVRARLLAVPGVSQVVAIGGRLPELQVQVRQNELLRQGVHLQEVTRATGAAHSVRSAGYLANTQGRELPIAQRAQATTPEQIGASLLSTRSGAPIPLSEVANVAMGGAPRRGTAADGGEPAVVLSVQKAPGTNTLALTEQVDKALRELEPTLPEGVVLNRHAFRQADFIERSVNHVRSVLRDAAIIVAIILMMFLMNGRATIITLVALPLSLAVGVLTMRGLDLTLNVMTLGGLAVAVGELVDDAIIDVENVIRRLRENRMLPVEQRRPHMLVVFEASNEIRGSVVFATLIICVVFLPLLQLQGLEGRFFQPLGIAYVVAVLASLVVALTVTPALCNLLLRATTPAPQAPATDPQTTHHSAHHGGRLARWLLARYEPLLDAAMKRSRAVLGSAAVATVFAVSLAGTYGTSFLPEFSEGSLTVFLMAPPGTSLAESDRLARGIERRLGGLAGVAGVVRRTGRAERDEHAEPVWSSEIDVRLQPGATKSTVRAAVDDVLAQVAGIDTMVGQPIEHRLSHILSGTPAALAINLYGEDLDVLRSVVAKASVALQGVAGARDINANREAMVTTLPVRYRRADLARWGLTAASAAEQLSTAFMGTKVATVRQGRREIDVVVRLHADERRERQQLEDFILRGAQGQLVRLADVATVAPDNASVVVSRENGQRKAVLSCNVDAGHNLGHVVAAARERIAPIAAAAGVRVHFGGQFEAERSARSVLLSWGSVALLLVLLLLRMALGSLTAAALVLLNLPLALIGGVVAVYIADSPSVLTNTLAMFGLSSAPYVAPVLSIASLIGFITLSGIAVRNGILLVRHYEDLQRSLGLDLPSAVRRGSLERLIPILMTALTAALGLVPLAMAAGEPGSELLAPLAVVVLGGLISSTALNLFVIPVAYTLVFARPQRQTQRHQLVAQGQSYVVQRSST